MLPDDGKDESELPENHSNGPFSHAATPGTDIIRFEGIQMDEILTIAEIAGKFHSEWVLIEDPSTDEFLDVRGGTVRWHDKDRDAVYRRAVEIRPKRFAIVYTGTMPGDTAIAL